MPLRPYVLKKDVFGTFVEGICTLNLYISGFLTAYATLIPDAAIRKMIATLDDPFTRFLEPEKFKNLQVGSNYSSFLFAVFGFHNSN